MLLLGCGPWLRPRVMLSLVFICGFITGVFGTWRYSGRCTLQTKRLYYEFSMPRVGLVVNSKVDKPYHPVEYSDLLVALRLFTEPSPDLYFELGLESGLIVVQCGLRAHSSEVITMHDQADA